MLGSHLINQMRRNHQYWLRLEDLYLELNVYLDPESNPGPFDLEPTAITVIPQCFGKIGLYITINYWRVPDRGR